MRAKCDKNVLDRPYSKVIGSITAMIHIDQYVSLILLSSFFDRGYPEIMIRVTFEPLNNVCSYLWYF